MGGDGASLAMADGVDEVVELDGCFVGPAFVDAHAGVGPLAHGVGMAQVISGDPRELRLAVRGAKAAPGPLIDPYLAGRVPRASAGASPVRMVRPGSLPRFATERPWWCWPRGRRRFPGPWRRWSRRVARPGRCARSGWRLSGTSRWRWSRTWRALGIVLVVRPDQAPPLASLAAAGVPLAFASAGGGIGPWRAIAAAVNHPDPAQRISGRAGFGAHTRGGWRSAGLPSNGALVPGAPGALRDLAGRGADSAGAG